MHFFVDLHQVF